MARALRTLGLTLCLALASGAAATRAEAAPTAEQLQYARELFAEAQREERAGNWTGALEALRKVAGIKLTPGIRFHTALCEEKLGMLVEALAEYEAAEREARQQDTQDVLQAVSGPLAALRARIPRLRVTVPAEVREPRVTIDGAPLAASNFGVSVPIAAGEHRVEATAPGRAPFKVVVATREQETMAVHVILPASGDATPQPGPAAGSPAGGGAAHDAAPQQPAAPSAEPGRSRTWAIAATGGAVALFGFGIASFAIAGGKQSDAQVECARQVSCDDLRGGVRTWDTLALGAWIGAAAAGAIAVVLWMQPSQSAPKAARAIVAGPGVVSGSF
jgi:hypothetical protein